MTLAKETDYIQLRTGVVTALAQGSNQARKTVESIRLHTYWTVGTLLSEYLNGIDRGYGDQTLKRLADDVDIDLRLLYEIVEFRLQVKSGPGATFNLEPLSKTHPNSRFLSKDPVFGGRHRERMECSSARGADRGRCSDGTPPRTGFRVSF